MGKLLIIGTLLCMFIAVSVSINAPKPPNYNYSFRVSMDESYKVNNVTYRVNGQVFYDPLKNRERVDRANGRYNFFCGSILPNVTSSCQSITSNGKRFYIFPEKSQCCFCCDSAHGCGILTPDWLKDAEYKGEEKIIDTVYDKWSQDVLGILGYNYLWVSQDANTIPRRLDENGAHVTDYLPSTFRNQTFADSVFALPAYCNEAAPTNCPLQSACGKFRSQ